MTNLNIEGILFCIFSLVAVGPALFIVFTKNLIYSAFALFLTFLGLAALYVLAGADFLAVTQIMVYVGGILVLLIFGIMLTQKTDKRTVASSPNKVVALLSREIGGALAGIGAFSFLSYVVLSANFRMDGVANSSRSTVKTLGVELMTSHLLPFEIVAILLLVALIGAAYLALNRNSIK